MTRLQQQRFLWRTGFFLLFIFAPLFNIFRYDLTLGHFIVFGQAWTLGLDALIAGKVSPLEGGLNLILRGFLPLASFVIAGIWLSWKYGRLYCGWLCPHFSVVEYINDLMLRASGKPSLWEKQALPTLQPDGSQLLPNARYWSMVIVAVFSMSLLWAVTLLTYLLPPTEIYYNLFHGSLTRNQFTFISVATAAFCIEFLLARHLFCRFGCAVGLFQSLVWMANDKAMVVGYEGARAKACIDCNAACDNACPMRLKPRSLKRKMFTCTQCAQCLSACQTVQRDNPQGALLHWVRDEAARQAAGQLPLAPVAKPVPLYSSFEQTSWKNR